METIAIVRATELAAAMVMAAKISRKSIRIARSTVGSSCGWEPKKLQEGSPLAYTHTRWESGGNDSNDRGRCWSSWHDTGHLQALRKLTHARRQATANDQTRPRRIRQDTCGAPCATPFLSLAAKIVAAQPILQPLCARAYCNSRYAVIDCAAAGCFCLLPCCLLLR